MNDTTRRPEMLDALQCILRERHSCRAFLDRPVPKETISQILATAQQTASWCNTQPWKVVVTSGAATEAFRRMYKENAESTPSAHDFPAPTEYLGVHLERRRACGGQLYQSVGIARKDRAAARAQGLRNYDLFGAPHVAIVTTEKHLGVYGAVDCGAYVANFMNAATALGVACIAQAALASRPDAVRSHFGLPPERQVVCGISFGYADRDDPVNGFRTSRAAIDEVVTWVGDSDELAR